VVDAELLDELAVNATASETMQVVDGWVVRASSLPFRRSNCAIALRGAGPLPLALIEEFYARRTQPGRVQVRTVAADGLDAQLASNGYEIEAAVDILVASLPTVVARTVAAPGLQCEVAPTLDPAFADRYCELHDGDERVRAYGRLLASIGPHGRAVTASIDGEPVGMGFGIVERSWCGLYGFTTLAHARGRGVGSTVLHGLARAVTGLNATDMYLQVERDNDPARRVYERAGFTYAYGYHYRTGA
jgi:N-acetylglutamate synthase